MPGYGLDARQRGLKPWGLDQNLLGPAKVFTDPLPGDVYLTELECRVLDSPPIQRLRRVRQLGAAHQVYPGAVHTRFSHVLGALRKAQDLLDAVLGHRSGLAPTPDLFQQWQDDRSDDDFDRSVAEVIVLTRLGALLHDLCHVAFGHTIEDDLHVLAPHDKNLARFERFWVEVVGEGMIPAELAYHLKPLIVSKDRVDPHADDKYRYAFVDDLVGNTICADLLDYLARDHYYTGLPMALGTRFLDDFYVSPAGPGESPHVVLRLVRSGRVRHDVLTEVLKHLRYRFEETERVLFHKVKLSADAMLGYLLGCAYDVIWREAVFEALRDDRSASAYLRGLDAKGVPRPELRKALALRFAEEDVPEGLVVGSQDGVPRPSPIPPPRPDRSPPSGEPPAAGSDAWFDLIDDHTRDSVETLFRQRGDDGLLEHLAFDWHPTREPRGVPGINRTAADAPNDYRGTAALRVRVAKFAQDLLDRRLYSQVGVYSFQHNTDQDAEMLRQKFVDKFGSTEARMDLERWVSAFVGHPDEPAVLLWIPSTEMRLKPADVLVNNGKEILELKHYRSTGENPPGESWRIVADHRNLWSLRVFVRPDLTESAPRILAWLARTFEDAGFDPRWDGEAQAQLGPLVADAVSAATPGLTHEEWLRTRAAATDALAISAREQSGSLRPVSFDDLVAAVMPTVDSARAPDGGRHDEPRPALFDEDPDDG